MFKRSDPIQDAAAEAAKYNAARAAAAKAPGFSNLSDIDAAKAVAEAQIHREALGNVKNVALAGLGVGVGARGLVGLYNLLKRNLGDGPALRSGPTELALPLPYAPEKKKKEALKLAAIGAPGEIPWYYPAVVGAGIGSLGLGWKGIDVLLNRERKKQRQSEISEARQDFHDAIMNQFDKPFPSKAAAEESAGAKLSRDLDTLFDSFTKNANILADAWGYAKRAPGAYGVYAGLTGLASGAIVYDQFRKRQRRAVLERALKERERSRFMRSPPEIFAVPEMVQRPEEEEAPLAERVNRLQSKPSPDDIGI